MRASSGSRSPTCRHALPHEVDERRSLPGRGLAHRAGHVDDHEQVRPAHLRVPGREDVLDVVRAEDVERLRGRGGQLRRRPRRRRRRPARAAPARWIAARPASPTSAACRRRTAAARSRAPADGGRPATRSAASGCGRCRRARRRPAGRRSAAACTPARRRRRRGRAAAPARAPLHRARDLERRRQREARGVHALGDPDRLADARGGDHAVAGVLRVTHHHLQPGAGREEPGEPRATWCPPP